MLQHDSNDLREIIRGGWIKSLRYYHRLNQEQFCKYHGLQRKTLWQWERELRPVPTAWLMKFYKMAALPRMEKKISDRQRFINKELGLLIDRLYSEHGSTPLNSIRVIQSTLYQMKKDKTVTISKEIQFNMDGEEVK